MPPKSHVFYIKSYLNGYCLDVAGNSRDAGAKVVLWPAKPVEEADNQLWYLDPYTMTIRSVLTDFCLEVDNDGRVNPYEPGNVGQRWSTSGQFMMNMDDHGKVLDIVGCSEDEGADICSWERHGKSNQRWYFEHVPRRYFYIISRKNGKALDVSGQDAGEGAEVIIWEKKDDPEDNQLWYSGRDGLIRSKLNGFVFDSSDGEVKMQPLDIRHKNQGFVYSDGRILNLHDTDRCLDIKGNDDDDGTNICEWDYHGGDNQLWRMEYIML